MVLCWSEFKIIGKISRAPRIIIIIENPPAKANPPLSMSIPPTNGAALVPDKTKATWEAASFPEPSALERQPRKIGMMAVGSVAKIGTTKKYCQAELLVDSPPVAIESKITKVRIG